MLNVFKIILLEALVQFAFVCQYIGLIFIYRTLGPQFWGQWEALLVFPTFGIVMLHGICTVAIFYPPCRRGLEK